MDSTLFYLFALLTVGGALATILCRNAVHCAVSLTTSLLGVAGLYLLQQAEFLFAIQIIIYIGGIMLLFLFVIMLVNANTAARERQFARTWPVSVVVAAGLGGLLIPALQYAGSNRVQANSHALTEGNTADIGRSLLEANMLPFEILSVLLLVAVVGAVLMARRRA